VIILKNAYVFTFNKNNDFGRYSILINDNKITDIADTTAHGAGKLAKWIEQHSTTAEIVDCSQKMIMPPLVNSCVKSEGSLLHYLLKRRHYEKTEEDLCTDLIFNYIYQELPGEENKQDLANIYNYSYNKLLKSGITSFNEVSLRRDANHLLPITTAVKATGQKVSVCYPIKQDVSTIRDYKYLNPSYYLTQENQLTVYDISNITELRNHGVRNLFLEAAVNKEITEKFKLTFHKSLIGVLDEYGLIDEYTSLINPLYLDYNDLKIITDRKANIIICPRDLNYFTNRYFPIDDYIGHGIKFSIGTGWLGEDLLKDVRLFRNKNKELNVSSAELLLAITKIPNQIYFNGDSSGCSIDINKQADMIFIDLTDLRFQFFAEDNEFESVCDFLIDNLSSFNISDVMTGGSFKVKDSKPVNADEGEIISNINITRERLYKTGKYEELKRKKETRQSMDMLDMSSRTGDEIKLFSETPEEKGSGESADTKEEFRIKTRIPSFRQKTVQGQRSLFEENEQGQITQSGDYQETPELNLLETDSTGSKPVEDEIIQAKAIDETIISRLISEKKPEKPKQVNTESKVELPKNVKLKFGDD
jgi:cytosine/adenosine deaminase-related metal-dependent hydrolase